MVESGDLVKYGDVNEGLAGLDCVLAVFAESLGTLESVKGAAARIP